MGRATQTRQRLVTTAAELFWYQGYAQTGVSEIMRRARATSGSFYHFFPTKDDLLLAVLESAGEKVGEEVLGEVERSTADPARRIAHLASAYREHVAAGADAFGLPIGALVTELGPGLGAARDRVGATYRGAVARVAGWLETESGPAADRRELAELVIGALEGAALMARASGVGNPVEVCGTLLGRWVDGETGVPDGAAVAARVGAAVGDWRAW